MCKSILITKLILISLLTMSLSNAQSPDQGPEGPDLEQTSIDPRLSAEATQAMIETAMSGEGDARVQATAVLWRQAADLQFADPASVSALQQLAYDDNPRVRRIAEKALKDMEHYLAQ